MIIGLTGRNGSGKGEVASFLKERGFISYSLSDVLRDELNARKIKITREALIEIGRELRTTEGPTVLADRILQKLDVDKNYVVDSIRNPKEVTALKRRPNFHLVVVAASPKTRFERTKARARESDPQTYENFLKTEERELSSPDPASQQLIETEKLADYILENEGTIEQLHEEITKMLPRLAKKKPRPDWDEYFIEIAKVISLRSNCIKRRVAAVIVKDKRIISTGYNGTPRGVKNCNEGGCPRCNQLSASGTKLDECLCAHAEENSITQSAYHGVTIKGSTIYTTFSPCLMCTKMIINSGIEEVVYNTDYPLGDVSFKLLKEAKIKIRQLSL